METTKSLEDLRHESEELDKEIERREQVLDEDGKPVSAEVVKQEDTGEWPHDYVEFMDEKWEAKKPKPQALAAFALASGKYITPTMQNDMVGLFIRNHLSEKSHARLYERMMDPEDDFNQEHTGQLMQRIATIGTDRPTEPSRP